METVAGGARRDAPALEVLLARHAQPARVRPGREHERVRLPGRVSDVAWTCLANAPAASTAEGAVRAEPFVLITNGRTDRSTEVTQSSAKVVENLSACRFISRMISPPDSPSRPG